MRLQRVGYDLATEQQQHYRNRRMMIARGWGMGKWGDVSNKAQSSNYKTNTF